MLIRKMEERDYRAYCALLDEVHGLHARNRPDIFREEAAQVTEMQFSGMLADGDQVCLAAEENGGMIGMCLMEVRMLRSAHVHHRPFGWIGDLCVRSDCRGRGIGTALYRAMKEQADQMGLSHIELMVWSFNEDAKRFYEKLGMNVRSYTMEDWL